jgi:alkylated DNA repair dioxygenase AlkB
MSQTELFPTVAELPDGFVYRPEFLSPDEEQHLVNALDGLQFEQIKMHGVVAKRRTVHFGRRYGFESFKLTDAPPVPDFLRPLQNRVADFAGRDSSDFAEVLVTEYRAGAQIGWHRDAPAFDTIVGVSLVGDCTMQFRRWPVVKAGSAGDKRTKPLAQLLAARSAYILEGSARTRWQHHIPPTKSLRYSITFRTLRAAH